LLLTIGLNFSYFRPEKFSSPADYYYVDRGRIRTQMSDILFDYLPVWAKKPPQVAPEPYETTAKIEAWQQKTGYFSFKTNPSQATTFKLNQYFFPGWQVLINGQKSSIDYNNDLGRIEFSLPAGRQQVEIKLNKTKLQFWADITSLFSWLAVLLFFLLPRHESTRL
jgi:hypothetical protein